MKTFSLWGGATLASDWTLEGTLDKTWQQIRDAMESKICVVVATDEDNAKNDFVQTVVDNTAPIEGEGRYQVYCVNGSYFQTDSKDGYPTMPQGSGDIGEG